MLLKTSQKVQVRILYESGVAAKTFRLTPASEHTLARAGLVSTSYNAQESSSMTAGVQDKQAVHDHREEV